MKLHLTPLNFESKIRGFFHFHMCSILTDLLTTLLLKYKILLYSKTMYTDLLTWNTWKTPMLIMKALYPQREISVKTIANIWPICLIKKKQQQFWKRRVSGFCLFLIVIIFQKSLFSFFMIHFPCNIQSFSLLFTCNLQEYVIYNDSVVNKDLGNFQEWNLEKELIT